MEVKNNEMEVIINEIIVNEMDTNFNAASVRHQKIGNFEITMNVVMFVQISKSLKHLPYI